MANEKRLKLIDYDILRTLFNDKYKETKQLILNGETHLDNLAEGFLEADRVICALPTVDAVEVTRCRDCKMYGNINAYTGTKLGFRFCNKFGNVTRDDDFCSYGERRDNDEH